MNRVTLMGRLAANPEVRVTQSGKKVCNFALAISMGKDKPAQFHDCVAWDNTAENLGRYTRKGNRILVEGRLDKSVYEKDGQKRYVTTVIVDRVEYADGANQPHGGYTPKATTGYAQTAQKPPVQASMDNGFGIPSNYGEEPLSISPDDLPF